MANPSDADIKAAQKLRSALDNLPDYYIPGADGGLYHALHPKADELILAFRAEARAEAETYCGECGRPGECPCIGNLREALATEEAAREQAERTVASIACMLGWENVPPLRTLEMSLSAIKARLTESEKQLADAQAGIGKIHNLSLVRSYSGSQDDVQLEAIILTSAALLTKGKS